MVNRYDFGKHSRQKQVRSGDRISLTHHFLGCPNSVAPSFCILRDRRKESICSRIMLRLTAICQPTLYWQLNCWVGSLFSPATENLSATIMINNYSSHFSSHSWSNKKLKHYLETEKILMATLHYFLFK